jgi:arylsulfatase A-like enzyme
MALEYMKMVKPRVMFVSFDETDDWAHEKRYDRVLDAINDFDKFIERLMNQIDSMREYRGRTAVIITADHGRGSALEDWHEHGSKTAGADRIWLAISGPGTSAKGEVAETAEQRDIAPTILKLMGIDPAEYKGATGKPIGAALR